MVEVIRAGAGELVCCGQPMERLGEKMQEVGQEKHVPVVERAASEVRIKVGSVPHPMEEKHYIEWVEVDLGEGGCRRYLRPGDLPEAKFPGLAGDRVFARAFCNVHGLWKST
jgi:superoxide reductase